MAERMTFVLQGRDELSRALNNAGDSAQRLHTRVARSASGSSRALTTFSRDANGRLRDAQGRFTTASRIITRALDETGDAADSTARQVTASTRDASAAVTRFARTADTRLRDARGRFVATAVTVRTTMDDSADAADDAARRVRTAADSVNASTRRIARDSRGRFLRVGDDADESSGGLRRFISAIGRAASSAAQAAPALGGAGAALKGLGVAAALTTLPALGAMVPMLAGAVTTGIAAKMAFSGVGEAAALAGEDSEAYAEALKEMSPAQRQFTKAVVGAKKEMGGLSEEVQGIVLPAFTRALKDARPALKVFGGGVKDMGKALAGFGTEFGKLFGSRRFQSALRTNLDLGAGFMGKLARPLADFTQSLLDFGAASKPTLDAFSRGIGGLLSKGLPGFFQGLQGGIKGSAAMFDGLFDSLNKILPALGELSGAVADAAGPALGEILSSAGDIASGALRGLASGARFLKPVFGELGGIARTMSIALGVIGTIAKEVGGVLLESLWPSFRDAENAVGPMQRLAGWLKENKGQVTEFTRVASGGIIDFVGVVIEQTPNVIKVFRLMVTGVLTALDGIVSGAAHAFGWIPGIGPKLKTANKEFDKFKNGFITGLHDAEGKTRDFANKVLPRLEQNKLKMDIRNWTSQIAIAKAKLSDKNLPKEKQAKLKADISNLQAKVRQARGELNSLKDRSVTVTTRYVVVGDGSAARRAGSHGSQLKYARGGLVRGFARGGPVQGYPGGGLISGPGTGTSDSILAAVSNGEFVVKARSVAKYGVQFLKAINEGRLALADGGRAASSAGGALRDSGADLVRGMAAGITGSAPLLEATARRLAALAVTAVRAELQIASPSKKMKAIGKQTGKGLIDGLTGSKSKIASTAKALAKAITDAFKGRNTKVDDRLVSMINKSNSKLQKLATQRDALAKKIANAKKFAADVKRGAQDFASFANFGEEEPRRAADIQAMLADRLARLRQFSAHVKQLVAKGLNKNMLRQILEMGPEAGAAFASSLAGASTGTIKEINALQSSIDKTAGSLGNAGADALYDSGKNAAKGFLAGLKSQQKAIEKQMLSIAKSMQKAIKKALGIKSPSRVMAQLGRYSTEGLARGLVDRIPAVTRAMGQVSGAVAAVRPVAGPLPVAAPSSGRGAPVLITVNGALDPLAVAQQLRKVLLTLKRTYGVNVELKVG